MVRTALLGLPIVNPQYLPSRVKPLRYSLLTVAKFENCSPVSIEYNRSPAARNEPFGETDSMLYSPCFCPAGCGQGF